MSTVVKDLVQKRWFSRRRSVKDDRVVVLSLSRRGDMLALANRAADTTIQFHAG